MGAIEELKLKMLLGVPRSSAGEHSEQFASPKAITLGLDCAQQSCTYPCLLNIV